MARHVRGLAARHPIRHRPGESRRPESPRSPESRAVRNHREATILLRAEVNALTALLIEAGTISSRTLTEQLIVECEHLDKQFEDLFPGFSSSDIGMNMKLPEAAETVKGWRP